MMDRRKFVETGAILGAAATLPKFSFASVKGSDKIKVGLVGCGGRGTGALLNMICADSNIKLVAIADLFKDKVDDALERVSKSYARRVKRGRISLDEKSFEECLNKNNVKKFVGWDAIDQLLKEDIDVVIEATPPVFRTPHFEKIVEAGKNAFLEKPVCIDIVQARKVLEISKKASEKGLNIVCGTQRRFHRGYEEIIKRVQNGEIGDIMAAQCYWNSSDYVGRAQLNHEEIPVDEVEYQVRNWFSFIWTSGDHIVEQHVHNLDVVMWALGDNRMPVDVRGMGGRSTDLPYPKYGDRFSHFAIDFDMGDGLRLQSYCQQDPGCQSEVTERVTGTKGIMYTGLYGKQLITDLKGKVIFQAGPELQRPECMEREHSALLNSIRSGGRINTVDKLVNSCLLAIAGRMSAFSGKKFKFDWVVKKSQESLAPEKFEFVKKPVGPVPVPGKYKLV